MARVANLRRIETMEYGAQHRADDEDHRSENVPLESFGKMSVLDHVSIMFLAYRATKDMALIDFAAQPKSQETCPFVHH